MQLAREQRKSSRPGSAGLPKSARETGGGRDDGGRADDSLLAGLVLIGHDGTCCRGWLKREGEQAKARTRRAASPIYFWIYFQADDK